VSDSLRHRLRASYENLRVAPAIPAIAVVSAAIYAALLPWGDLRAAPLLLLTAHASLLALMFAGWRGYRRRPAAAGAVLLAALVFRLIAACGAPALSDDVYRYVWDGRLQLHGVHPYRFAPDDPSLVALRDADWARINHPELKTIYPPTSQIVFLVLAALGAGPTGFKLAIGLLDFGAVLALRRLLRPLGVPRDRVILYAWNPLAVLETAGSGHIEPLGILLVLLATGWIIGCRPRLSMAALAAATWVKLLPALLLPAFGRRSGPRGWAAALLVLAALVAPYALTGPAVGGGLLDYAERWQRNAFLFAGVERAIAAVDPADALKAAIAALQRRIGGWPIPWDALYRHVWPGDLARLVVAVAVAAWALLVALRGRVDPLRQVLLVLGAALLLSPTVHPWYVLWVLPFAAARLSWGWLLLAALIPLSYLSAPGAGDVSWTLRWVIWGPSLALLAAPLLSTRHGRRRRDEGSRPTS